MPPVPQAVSTCLYRIAQEAIGNALRHAGAKRVAVRIVPSGSDVLLEVEDDIGTEFPGNLKPQGRSPDHDHLLGS